MREARHRKPGTPIEVEVGRRLWGGDGQEHVWRFLFGEMEIPWT